jgi:hypothetical protein
VKDVERLFVASQTEVTCCPISPELNAAVDILMDAGLAERNLPLLIAAERSGKNPEQLARKLVRLADALKAPLQ